MESPLHVVDNLLLFDKERFKIIFMFAITFELLRRSFAFMLKCKYDPLNNKPMALQNFMMPSK